jgi:uncharacterized protein DUF5916
VGVGASLLAIAALQSSVAPVSSPAETAPVIRVVRATGPIHIDGRLDEPDWALAEPAREFTQLDPVEGEPASERTEVRVLIDGTAIYIGALMFDADPAAIVSRLARRDNLKTDADWFAVFIDAYHDHRTALEFGITPAGTIVDASLGADGGREPAWDPVWESKTRIDERGWVAEIRIPLSQLRYNDQDDAVWGIQFTRKILRKQETDLFAFVPKSEHAGINRYGHLTGLGKVRAPRRLELVPHGVMRGEDTAVDPGNPFRNGRDVFLDAGFETLYGVTSALTLDGAVRPDFGQVEVDPAVINLSAFEIQYDEKRPFFIEGEEYFAFARFSPSGGSDFPELFFSRRIGHPPTRALSSSRYHYADVPGETTILGAAKLSGKLNGKAHDWSLGVLEAVTPSENARYLDDSDARQMVQVEPLSNYFVGRAARDFRNGDTSVGALVTAVNRDLSDPTLATLLRSSAFVAGVDLNHSWDNRTWIVDAALVGSAIQGSPEAITAAQRSSARYFQRPDATHLHLDPTRTSLAGRAAQIGLTKLAGFHWRGSLGYQEVSPGFEANDLGFQRHADVRSLAATIDYRENRPGPVLRNWRVQGYGRQRWDFGQTLIRNSIGLYGYTQLSNYWSVFGQLDVSFETLDNTLTRGGPLAVSPEATASTVTVTSDDRKRSQLIGSAIFSGDAYGSRTRSGYLSASVNWSPNIRFSTSPSLTYTHAAAQYAAQVPDPLATMTNGQRYVFADLDETTFGLPTRLDWTFTPQMSLQLYVQPFFGHGTYDHYAEFRSPRNFRFDRYGEDRGTIDRRPAGSLSIDPDGATGPAVPFTLFDPSFDVRTVRSSVVFRWEYRPGSQLFFAFQRRSNNDQAVVIKATYWIGL